MDSPASGARPVEPTSLGSLMVGTTAYALARLADGQPGPSPTAASACEGSTTATLASDRIEEVDVEAVAGSFVDRYPQRRYPGVVIGSPHGAAAHLAALLGLPYLPSSFDVKIGWPGGAPDDLFGALGYGSELAARLLSANRAPIAVRQVHDPALRPAPGGWPVHLVVRWLDLPAAYRRFMRRYVASGSMIVVSDARLWPVLQMGMDVSLQVGRTASGLQPEDFESDSQVVAAMIRAAGGKPDRWGPPEGLPLGSAEHGLEPAFALSLRQWARSVGATVQRIVYSRPGALSAGVADLYRTWLERTGDRPTHSVVECGRQLDAWSSLCRGIVPYWCENPARSCVVDAEWWLAGSARFDSVDVVPDSPGLHLNAFAPLGQWAAVAAFGERQGRLNPAAASAYPDRLLPPTLVTDTLARYPQRDLPPPRPMPTFALTLLAGDRTVPGLMVSRPQP
jgi:hypothetical protein